MREPSPKNNGLFRRFLNLKQATPSSFLWYSTFPLCYTETRQTIPQTATVGQKRRSGSPPERRFVIVPESEASGLAAAPLPILMHCEWPGLWIRFPGPVPTGISPQPGKESRMVCWDPVPAFHRAESPLPVKTAAVHKFLLGGRSDP